MFSSECVQGLQAENSALLRRSWVGNPAAVYAILSLRGFDASFENLSISIAFVKCYRRKSNLYAETEYI
jgi:hypothetical protein